MELSISNKASIEKMNSSNDNSMESMNISENDTEIKEVILSSELYKNKSIINFKNIEPYKKDFNNYSLFEKKLLAEQYINEYNQKNNQYTIEDLLYLDDTNKKIQNIYMQIAIDKLNNLKNNNEFKEILIEKIKKSSIILDQEDFDKNILMIKDEEISKNLVYINYKKSLINTLKFILEIDDSTNCQKAKEKLNLEKIYKFNQNCGIGEKNYFFYELCLQLFNKIEYIYNVYNLYIDLINDILLFLEKENLDNLNKEKIFNFKYLSQFLFDEYLKVTSKQELDKIYLFLKGDSVSENEIIESIKKMDNFQRENNIQYKLEYDKNSKKLSYIIKEKTRVNFRKYYYTIKNSYELKHFNKKILKILKYNIDQEFESNLFKKIIFNADINLLNFYHQNFNRHLNLILKKILSSQSSKKFFHDYFTKKYKNIIEYHFDKIEVQNEIINKIIFIPFIEFYHTRNSNSFTNPLDMTIMINSTPGDMVYSHTHGFNRKIMNFGRILVFCLREIFSYYLQYYYSYYTRGNINLKQNIQSIYIEYKFIGLKDNTFISINEVLQLLYSNNYDEYPIIKRKMNNKFNKKIMKKIVEENKELFDFITENNESDSLNKLNINKEPKILLEDYLDILKIEEHHSSSLTHCSRYDNYSIRLV